MRPQTHDVDFIPEIASSNFEVFSSLLLRWCSSTSYTRLTVLRRLLRLSIIAVHVQMVNIGRDLRHLLAVVGVGLLLVTTLALLPVSNYDPTWWLLSHSPHAHASRLNITSNALHIGHSMPPLYSEFKKFEAELPQHDAQLPFPEGQNGVFICAAFYLSFLMKS